MVWLARDRRRRRRRRRRSASSAGTRSPGRRTRRGVRRSRARADAASGRRALAELLHWAASARCVEVQTAGRGGRPGERSRGPSGAASARSGANSMLVLDLTAIEAPEVDPPAGHRDRHLGRAAGAGAGMYEVAVRGVSRRPGRGGRRDARFEEWLSNDMQGASDRPEATFVALAGDEVVGYAKLSLSTSATGTALHDMTGVKRAWRGRGIAGALKRAEIAWAKDAGLRAARDAERGAERADPPPQRAPRLRRRARRDRADERSSGRTERACRRGRHVASGLSAFSDTGPTQR